MARTNTAALVARIAELEAQVASLLKPMRAAAHKRNAATVYLNGTPRYTALTHSEAFRAITEAKAAGMRAMYIPLSAQH